jgi:hypothetical protein
MAVGLLLKCGWQLRMLRFTNSAEMLPNQRLHLTPRQGRCGLLAQSFVNPLVKSV